MTRPLNRIGLTSRQTVISVLIGTSLWFIAAIILAALAPTGIYEGSGRFWLYVLIVPITLPFVPLTRILAGLPHDRIGTGVALATATAALLDSVALAWFPALYGGTTEFVAGAGAAILWGAGVAMMLGFALNRPT